MIDSNWFLGPFWSSSCIESDTFQTLENLNEKYVPKVEEATAFNTSEKEEDVEFPFVIIDGQKVEFGMNKDLEMISVSP